MKKISLAVFGLLFVCSVAGPAKAFTRGACMDDGEKYCKGKPLMSQSFKQCMIEHLDELSDACKTNMFEMAAKKKQKQAGNN